VQPCVQRIGRIIHVAKVRKSLESTVLKRLCIQNLLREIVVFYIKQYSTVVFSHYSERTANLCLQKIQHVQTVLEAIDSLD
jgi:hypothetical protein